jgi:primosomal protein N' (replication factor Y)
MAKVSLVNYHSKYGNSSVNSLIEKGFIIVSEKQIYRNVEMIKKEDNNFVLTDQQKNAVDIIKNSFGEVVLLHGVTGSGKTEVYMHAISEILKLNKTAIMLVPEISLTPQVLSNFKSRFGEKVAILHSGLSAGERYDEWLKLFRGEAKIAVGARSAIFAPLENLGLIVIDEEHDSSYNSDSNPRYNTIEVAKLRAKYNNACLVLGSATPSIESYYYSKIGEYKLVELIGRVNNKAMPTINIVDMYGALLQGEYGTFSNTLIEKLNRCILDKKQAIIFINRRGFVSFLMCTKCGYVPKCTDCDVDLVYHKDDNLLKCHYCDKRYKVLTKCPNCGGTEFRNGAIGTQKVAEELKNLFPNVPIFRMDNDTTRTKNAHLKILSQFGETKPSILVGTQMIAKGHDFPFVTLVGIVDADISLHQSDFRATEKTFQLVTQVSGRAGRSDYTGEVVLQTYSPKHYVYRYASSYDYKGFFEKECDIRKTTMFPPFAKIIRIIFNYEEENILVKVVKNAFDKINELKEKYKSEFIFCKAMACPVKKIKTKLRYQILLRIKTDKEKEIIEQIFNIVDNLEKIR